MVAHRPRAAATIRRLTMAAMGACTLAASAPITRATPIPITPPAFQDVQNLKQLALAMHNYADLQGTLPPQYLQSASGTPTLSWRVLLLPYLGYDSLYNAFDLSKPWNDPANLPLLSQMPDVYLSPSDPPGTTSTHYQVPTGPTLLFTGPTPTRPSSITDGTSNTLLLGTAATPTPWTQPTDLPPGPTPQLGPTTFSSPLTPNYTPFALADGSVRFLSNDTPTQTLLDLFTPNDGHTIDPSVFYDYTVVPEPTGLAASAVAALLLARRKSRRA